MQVLLNKFNRLALWEQIGTVIGLIAISPALLVMSVVFVVFAPFVLALTFLFGDTDF